MSLCHTIWKVRRKSIPSTLNARTLPRASGTATSRRGSTATPSPSMAAFTSAPVLALSHRGSAVTPAAARARSNTSLVPLPGSRSKNFCCKNSSLLTSSPCSKGPPGEQIPTSSSSM